MTISEARGTAIAGLSAARISPVGLGLFLALIAVSVPVFWIGIEFLGQTWMTPEYSHGPLIPLISLYLFLRERRDFPPVPADTPTLRWPGFLVLCLGLALGAAGNLTQIPDVASYGIIVWTSGVVLICFGWAEGRRHQLPVLHLIFMLALPTVIYFKMSIFLQGISSEIGVAIVKAMGIPVFLEGNIIDLGVYKLHVAEACSGLRYLFPILSFSYLTAILYRGPMWHKFLLFAAAAPIAVLMNAVRIGVIGVLVNRYGIEHAIGFTHVFEGWVIFLICVALLFLMAIALQRLTPDPKPLGEAVDLDFRGLPAEFGRIRQIAPSLTLALAVAVSAAASAAFVVAPPAERQPIARESYHSFPRTIAQWQGLAQPLAPEIEAALGADDYISATYARANGDAVSFFSAFYERQTKGDGLHSPEVCLPGAGWEIFSFDTIQVEMPDTVYGTFALNRAIIQKGESKQLVYYWFEQRGKRMTNDIAAKISVVVDEVTMGRSDGAIVRFVTPIGKREPVEAADARIRALMTDLLPTLPRFLPL